MTKILTMKRPLTDEQRRALCDLIYQALLEVRTLGWADRAAQAADLADAFHNLPRGLWRDDFDLVFFRDAYLVPYETKYTPAQRLKSYVQAVNAIMGVPDGN